MFKVRSPVAGLIDANYMRELLTSMGDTKLTNEEVDAIFRDTPPTFETGKFDYSKFAKTIKHGVKEDAKNAKPIIPPKPVLELVTDL